MLLSGQDKKQKKYQYEAQSASFHILTPREHQSNNQAAYTFAFSKQLSAAVRNDLTDAQITFDQLRNTPDALESLQSRLFEVVHTNMLLAPCSGAFYFLNTTVNDSLPDKSYSGLYLKYANIYAENTIHNEVCLFRGFSTIAREKDINLHSTWQLETLAGSFPEIDKLMSDKKEASSALNQERLEAQSKQQQLQGKLEQVSNDLGSAQKGIARLAYSRQQEIDPDDFQYFLKGIHQLTPTERKVFDLYLDGKNAKEILTILSITENTLKFHNKNIYNKLGVSSRKQLLRYATLMKHQK